MGCAHLTDEAATSFYGSPDEWNEMLDYLEGYDFEGESKRGAPSH